MIKLFVIMMRNNSPEIMTKQQRYRQKFLEKDRRYYEELKRGYKKWFAINTRHCLKNKTIKIKNMLEINIRICLKKANKKQKNMENATKKYVRRRQNKKKKEYIIEYRK